MEKSRFERFIAKYNLGGTCESVLYKVENSITTAKSISDNKNILCEVVASSIGLKDGSYGVYDTAKLLSLLGVVGEQLTANIKKSGDKPVSITFDDNFSQITFVLADSSVIPAVPDLKTTPVFDSIIEMDEKFINTFIKAAGALSEVDTFTVMSDGDSTTADVILGHSTMNTNRVKIKATLEKAVKVNEISFSAKDMRNVLLANKEAKGGKLEISSKGICRMVFVVDSIKSTYHLLKINTKD